MKYLVLALCLGLFAGTISNVQAQTLNPGTVILADDHGTLTKDNYNFAPFHPEDAVKVTPACSPYNNGC